jgi:hypothetical protein
VPSTAVQLADQPERAQPARSIAVASLTRARLFFVFDGLRRAYPLQ